MLVPKSWCFRAMAVDHANIDVLRQFNDTHRALSVSVEKALQSGQHFSRVLFREEVATIHRTRSRRGGPLPADLANIDVDAIANRNMWLSPGRRTSNSLQASRSGRKPPKIMRLPSN